MPDEASSPGFSNGQTSNNLANGCFSVPQGGNYAHPSEVPLLTDDDLNIITNFEEEQHRLGNFERIFPLQHNVTHYAKFFEYTRPSNELLGRYLKLLPQGVSSVFEASPKKSVGSPSHQKARRK
mmetsp:Transcript_26311/g.40153  ORF Transcript_26311/g.40153 Transcript_26311/m.40153 type:complete len:124 (+) Transcript_26311:3610-3981(+)